MKYSPLHVTVSNVNKTLTHDLTWPESPRLVFHWQFWLFYDEGNNFRDPTLLRDIIKLCLLFVLAAETVLFIF